MRSSFRLILILLTVVTLFTFYRTIIRRRSPKAFLTRSDIMKRMDTKNSSHIYSQRIPRIVHQTWKNSSIPARWNSSVASVRKLNEKKFEYRLWTDEDMHEFVREREPKLYVNTFQAYPYNIQRVDAFRYILLYHLGGVYIDMDAGCSRSLDTLLETLEALDSQAEHLAALPQTSPIGVSNDFMISTKSHPLFGQLVSHLSLFNHYYVVYYLTIMLSAGPLYLSFNEHLFERSSNTVSVRIIEGDVYTRLYLWFAGGNSWHGRDARLIAYIYQRWDAVKLNLTNILYCFITCVLVLSCLRYRHRLVLFKRVIII